MHRVRLIVLALVAALLAAFLPPAGVGQSQTLHPRILLGKWSGRWTERTPLNDGRSGEYDLTITKIEGDRIEGLVESTNAGETTTPFRGTLNGSRFVFGRDSVTELNVDGTRIEGMRHPTRGKGFPWKIQLKKEPY